MTEDKVKKDEIKAKKETLNAIFSDFWFVIPEYQRSYVWEVDNVNDLLDDLWFACENKFDHEYFLGSLVLKKNLLQNEFNEFEVLDGQQRLTTFFILMAVIRDLSSNDLLKKTFHQRIYQEKNEFAAIPERKRIIYKIRDNVETFIDKYILASNGTQLKETNYDGKKNVSITNMINAIDTINLFFSEKPQKDIELFAKFLAAKPIFIYVSTENLEDAFRLFTILNNRGVPLTNSDILKSINIGEINKDDIKLADKYAEKWEKIENELGANFDRFLSFIRTILVKVKARKNLLEEFEENIYEPKTYDKETKKYFDREPLLKKGKQTIDFIEKYKSIHDKLINLNSDFEIDNEYKNLITIMLIGLPSEDWIPPLLLFYNKFQKNKLTEFLQKLEYKFSSDWILQKNPTERLENMQKILEKIESSENSETVLNSTEIFEIEKDSLRAILNENVYGHRFARYILLKWEYLKSDNTVHLSDYKTISVEHILPQNPPDNSKWKKVFDEENRNKWTHKLANLVLINMRKNTQLSNLDFIDKKRKYLEKRIDVFKGTKIFIDQNNEWSIDILEKRQIEMLNELIK